MNKLIKLSLLTSAIFILNACGDVQSSSPVIQKETNTSTLKNDIVLASSNEKKLKKNDTQTAEVLKKDTKEVPEKVSGDSSKGQKLYAKKLKEPCGMKGGKFSQIHTQKEWVKIQNEGKMADEIASICHGTKIRDKYLLDISAFVNEYASDSGNMPSGC